MPLPDPRRESSLPFSLVALLALGHCAAFADRNLPAVAAPLLRTDLGLSDAQIGLLQGPAYAVLYAVGMLATLPLASSRHRFRVLAACIVTWVMGMALFALSRSFEAMCAARALVGLGQSAFVPLALGLIVEGAPPHWRGRAMAVFTAGSVIGRSMALLLGGAILAALVLWLPRADMAHWRLLFLTMAVPNLILIGILLRCRERAPLAPRPAAGLSQIFAWWRGQPLLMMLYLCGAGGAVLVVQTVGAWAPSILNREQGLAPADAALAFGASLLCASPLGHLLAGFLVDAHGKRMTPMTITAGGLLLAVPMLWVLPQVTSATVACALLALVSLVGGTAAVAALAGLPPMLPLHLRGPATRLFLVFITVVGVGLGPYVAGLVSDGLGEGGNDLSTALGVVCMSAAIVGIGAALLAQGGWRRVVAETAA
jgi:MFS family permease